jgi:hypothetical protein
LKPGEKRRKNAKAPTITKAVFVHENDNLFAFLDIAFEALGLELEWGIDPDTGRFDYFFYDMRFSLLRSTLKDVAIMSDKDYRTVIDEAVKKDNPGLKVLLTALPKPKVRSILFYTSLTMSPLSMNYLGCRTLTTKMRRTMTQATKRPKTLTRRKSGYIPDYYLHICTHIIVYPPQTQELSPEEVEEAEIIKELSRIYRCQDAKCPFDICWVSATDSNTRHIHLTFRHLRLWSSGIMGKREGVTLQQPPNDKLFDLGTQSTADANLLATRRGRENSNQPSITVNLAGLADLVQPLRNRVINTPDSPSVSRRTKLPPKMSLEEFVKRYNLSNSISRGLDKIEVTGPHALRFIPDSVLSDSAMLSVGQIADIRDAQERWQNNDDENVAP